jgi:hypothetical protein
MLSWRRRYYIGSDRRWWDADAGGGVTYALRPAPFRGWQAARHEGNKAIYPPLVKTKAEAVAWCERDHAERAMEIVGIA